MQKLAEYQSILTRGLIEQIERCSDNEKKREFERARDHLSAAVERVKRSAGHVPDRRQAAQLLYAAGDLLMASADAASRIDRSLLPPVIEMRTKRVSGGVGGKASGKKRAQFAADQWQTKAIDLANAIREEKPRPTTEIAQVVEARWPQDAKKRLPVKHERLVRFLRERRVGKNGRFSKESP